jgi:hypothetical protein
MMALGCLRGPQPAGLITQKSVKIKSLTVFRYAQ